LDEVQLKIKGTRHWLWRAVDRHGIVLDILVQQRRDQHAAETFLRRVVAAAGCAPRVVITDKLASYPPALRRVLPKAEHRRHRGLNNRAENSHAPARHVSEPWRRLKSPKQARTSSDRLALWAITSEPAVIPRRPTLDDSSWRNGAARGARWLDCHR
jgi:putative transposase